MNQNQPIVGYQNGFPIYAPSQTYDIGDGARSTSPVDGANYAKFHAINPDYIRNTLKQNPITINDLNVPMPQQPQAPTPAPTQNTNIVNPTTGQKGYQVPGSTLSAGWQWTTAPNNTNLPAATPNNTTNINQVGAINTNTGNPSTQDTSSVNGLMAFYQKQFDVLQQKQVDEQAQMQAAREQQKTQTSGFLSNILSSKSPTQTGEDAFAKTGINPIQYFADEKAKIAEIGALNDQYSKLIEARDSQIAATNDKLGSMNFINNQVAQITRNAAPQINQLSAEINSKAAALQASQGMFQEAQSFVDKAVQSATADLSYNVTLYKTFYDQNQNIIDNLDSKYQAALKDAMSIAEKAYTQAYSEKTDVGKLIIDNPQAGITINDTLVQALNKISLRPKATKPDIFGSGTSGYSQSTYDPVTNTYKTSPVMAGTNPAESNPVKLSSTQLNTASSLLGITADQYKQLDPQVQTYFTTPFGKTFITAITKDVPSGKSTYQEVKDSIDASNQPAQVKEYMQQLLDKQDPQKPGDSGFFAKLGNWFQGGGFQ